jgi:hypothetical protein
MPRLLIVALGALGATLLEASARRGVFDEIIVATRSPERVLAKINNARIGAALEGHYPQIRVAPFDMYAPNAGAELQALHPDVIFASPSMLPWWRLPNVAPPLRTHIADAPFATFLPLHLAPMLALQRAMHSSGLDCPWIGASYPDVVNHVLACIGAPPTCGTGNLQEAIPKVHFSLQHLADYAPEKLRVWLVAQHAFEYFCYASTASEATPPYLLRAELGGRDVSAEARASMFTPFPIPYELDLNNITVSASLSIIEALAGANGIDTHVPAPNGMLGGYPVRVDASGVKLRLDEHWPIAQAVATNRASLPFDGIAEIATDGTVLFSDATARVLTQITGQTTDALAPADVPRLAATMYAKLTKA